MSSSSSSATSLSTANATSTPMSSAAACSNRAKLVLKLPSGYHFVPSDVELVVHYLRPRLADANCRLPLPIFVHDRILNYHPDTLIEKYRNYGEDRWFFFTEREPKHPGGNRPNRTTPDNGHWNATGSIRPIRSAGGVLVGCCRTLVFYEASRSRSRSRKKKKEEDGDDDGVKTDWTMYEYMSLTSEAEFEAVRNGIANKMGELVLCTIQKKKHSQEEQEQEGGGERKKSTKRKTIEEEDLELDVVPADAGDVEEGSHAGTTTEGQHDDHVQRALMEAVTAAAAGPLPELAAYYAPGAAGVANFSVNPYQSMPYHHYFLSNSLSPVPTPPQETLLMAPPAASGVEGDNHHVVMHQQQNYYFFNNNSMNMKNSQSSFHAQAQAAPPQEFLPYLDTNTKIAAPPHRGWSITMADGMLQNRFGNMTPSKAPPVPGTGLSRSKSSDVCWERSVEQLYGDQPNMALKPEDVWWSSHLLPERELNSPYVTNSSSSSVPTHQQETTVMETMELAARGRSGHHSHTSTMHQRNYLNQYSMNMRNYSQSSSFHAQTATLPQEEFLPCYSSTNMASLPPLVGGGGADNVVMDHHVLQNRIVNMTTPAAESHTLINGFCPGLSNYNYGHLISTTRMVDHPAGPSSVPFPSQQYHGAGSRTGNMQGPPLLNNKVNLINHKNSAAAAAASMVGYDQRNGVGFSTQDRLFKRN